LDAIINIQNHKYRGKTIVISFLNQIFSNCGPLKKEIYYIKDYMALVLKLYIDTANV